MTQTVDIPLTELENRQLAKQYGVGLLHVDELRVVFDSFDKGKTGSLSVADLQAMARHMSGKDLAVSRNHVIDEMRSISPNFGSDTHSSCGFEEYIRYVSQVKTLLDAPGTATGFKFLFYDEKRVQQAYISAWSSRE